MVKASEVRERSSALGHIMVGAELSGVTIPLGKVDQDRLNTCLQKQSDGKTTPAMERDLKELTEKSNKKFVAKLSAGAKTRVSDKWFGENYDYTKRFVTNATRKGNIQEWEAIQQSSRFLGYQFATKNLKHFEDEFTHGTPDWIPKQFVFDTKCVWEPKGLDFFTDDLNYLYEWQIKDYQRLTGRSSGAIIRILMNPPESMIYKLAQPLWEEAGYHWSERITDEFLEAVKDEYDFEGKKPIEDRIKIIRVDLTEKDDKLIKQQIGLMREEWARLDELNARKNIEEINYFRFNQQQTILV